MMSHGVTHVSSGGMVRLVEQTYMAYGWGKNWVYCLPLVLTAMHITPTKEGLSPFEILFGRSYQIPEL